MFKDAASVNCIAKENNAAYGGKLKPKTDYDYCKGAAAFALMNARSVRSRWSRIIKIPTIKIKV